VELERVFHEDPGEPIRALVWAYMRRSVEPFRDTPMWSQLDPSVVLTAEIGRLRDTTLDIVAAIDACHRLNEQLVDAMAGCDLLLCPTTCGQTPLAWMPTTAAEIMAVLESSPEALGAMPTSDRAYVLDLLSTFDEINLPAGVINGELAPDWTRMTQAFNLTGSPAGTAHAGFTSNGMPVGLQVVGGRNDDPAVLGGLALLEQLHAEGPARAPEGTMA
jgi:Asp-tRNA(Asn)/Glu-tRNA(Gln) amidotransferase A subunit family amidase